MRTLGLLLLISGAASAQGAPDTPDAETLEDTAEALRQRAEELGGMLQRGRFLGLRPGRRCDQGVPMPSLGLEGGPAPVPIPTAELEGRMAPMPNLCGGPGLLAAAPDVIFRLDPLRERLDRLPPSYRFEPDLLRRRFDAPGPESLERRPSPDLRRAPWTLERLRPDGLRERSRQFDAPADRFRPEGEAAPSPVRPPVAPAGERP